MGILDFLFPKGCIGCGRGGTYFCQKCSGESVLAFPQVCPVCERPSPDGLRHRYCHESFSPNGLLSVWAYQGTPRKLIIKLKYRFVSDIATNLANKVAFYLKNYQPLSQKSLWTTQKFTLVSIPLHWKRKNWRGFNHTDEVGRLVAKQMGWGFADILVRTKNTKHQVGLKEKDRRENVEGVFSVKPNILKSQYSNILLFDDVWTTGSTLKEATKTLKRAGVRKVWCLTLAR